MFRRKEPALLKREKTRRALSVCHELESVSILKEPVLLIWKTKPILKEKLKRGRRDRRPKSLHEKRKNRSERRMGNGSDWLTSIIRRGAKRRMPEKRTRFHGIGEAVQQSGITSLTHTRNV